ncbi:DinB family protein [Aureitalea marina]|uniref:DinB-like domain-containing protein n=1 Tax=Aureitalea marina TaxID=930804 RepID=A0A2S7KPI4_9FLAO|nr:DinB family protein [Aureitalea marina]PQB04544.1 hypothetical protein BST85_06255 [Aureitalea marina]
MSSKIDELIAQYHSLHNGQPWMGRSFHATWLQINEEVSFSKPIQGAPSIAQLVDHLTFWRKQALDKIAHGQFEAGDNDPDNWKTNTQLKVEGWNAIRLRYASVLKDYLGQLSQRDDSFLERTYQDPDFKKDLTYAELLQGVLHHDIYHLGQIRLILSALSGE